MNNTVARPRLKNRPPFAFGINEIVVTLWIGSSFYIMYATGGKNEYLLFLPLIGGAIVLPLMTLKKPVIATVDPLLSVGVFLLNLGILASYLFNTERYDLIFILGNIVSSLLLFVSLYTITMKIDLDFRKTLILQSVFATLLLPAVLATSKLQWGRVMPAELTPNYVSMMALLCFIGACGVRSLWGALALAALPLYTILVMESRDSTLSAGIVLLIIATCHFQRVGWEKLRPCLLPALVGGPAVCIGLILLGVPVFGFMDNIVERLFLLNDEHRGLSSGGSGRIELWNAAADLWLSHPLFGVGFKGHRLMMPDQMYAHSAYLGMLADVGLVGFASYLIIVGVAVYRTLKRKNRGSPEYPLQLAIIFSYLIYGMFESRAFGFGNSYSLIFLLVAFDSSKRRLKNVATPEFPHATSSPGPREPASPSVARTIPWSRSARQP